MPHYLQKLAAGITDVSAGNDASHVSVSWSTAFQDLRSNSVAYHIYYSTDETKVFSDGVKFIALSGNSAQIHDLTPGDTYYFAVRAVEYDSNAIATSTLTQYQDNLYVYPSSLLRSNITDTDLVVPVLDSTLFPANGIVLLGRELIKYSSKDNTLNNLNVSTRGYFATEARAHDTDGYDGYVTSSADVTLFLGIEEQNTKYFEVQCRFDIDQDHYHSTDGYRQVIKDVLTTDLAGSDQANVGFQPYDYAGWHRTDPVALLSGQCVGSYIGGEQFCADGYNGVGMMLRGMSVQEQNNQRQEVLLSLTGEPVVLIQRRRTGINCSCYLPSSTYPDDRCPKCLGGGFIVGYDQYFNPRQSDGRIMVRFEPGDEDLKMQDAGLESEVMLNCWTLVVPTIKDRDIIVRFDQDNNEEFRYEVLSVTRNKLLNSLSGAQKFKVQRIRKTDSAYQIPVFRDTSTLPSKLNTGIGSAPGILPHTHTITVSNRDINEFHQITSTNSSHSHPVIINSFGQIEVLPVLGHTHTVMYP